MGCMPILISVWINVGPGPKIRKAGTSSYEDLCPSEGSKHWGNSTKLPESPVIGKQPSKVWSNAHSPRIIRKHPSPPGPTDSHPTIEHQNFSGGSEVTESTGRSIPLSHGYVSGDLVGARRVGLCLTGAFLV